MGLWSGLKKGIKKVGGGAWSAVKWGGSKVKGVVDSATGLVSGVASTAGGIIDKAGDTIGSGFSFLKILPWVGLAVAGIVVYFLFFKGGANTAMKAAS